MSVLSYILLFVATILLAGLGIYLYSKKKNENATKPLPFKCSVRPLQYVLIFDAILLCSTFFELITDSLIWCLIGGALALFFGFIIFNAFADKSFNAVFKGARHMAFIGVMTVVLGIVFVADVFHIYKAPQPDTDKINYAYLHVSFNYSDREEYSSYNFDKDIEGYYYKEDVIEITKDNVGDLKDLYALLEDNYYFSDKIEESDVTISVSMGIECEGDLGNYHKHLYLTENSENYEEVMALLEDFKDKYPPQYEKVYYYEIEETEKTDPELLD